MTDPTSEDIRRETLEQTAKFFARVAPVPVTRTPVSVGLDFEDISFKAEDGVTLRAWHIPSTAGKKLVIFNHFMLANRAGAVANPEWGNIAVDFMPIYKALVDAGYSVLTYDMRNHGESDVYKDGSSGLTHWEYRDVLASVRYAKEHYAGMDMYLFSQCYGTVATIRAMESAPEEFKDIKAFVNLQPLSLDAFIEGMSGQMGFAQTDNVALFSEALEKETGFAVADCRVEDIASSVNVPTLTVQVRKDWRTTEQSIEDIHNGISSDDKTLYWIEDESERLEGYNYFGRKPEMLIEWLNAH